METSNVKDSNGTLVKKIRLTDDDKEVDCKIDGMSIVLKTEFLKKR